MTSPGIPDASTRVPLPRFGVAGSLLLDGLRAAASQIVVVGHAVSFLGLWAWLEPPMTPWMQDAAVVTFFVLSGLLITHSVRLRMADPDRDYRPSDFFIDRTSRIYTAYLPALVVVVVADAVGRRWAPEVFGGYADANGPLTFMVNLLMLQDFPLLDRAAEAVGMDPSVVEAYGTGRPLWTVAAEWWIYLAVGWVLVARHRSARHGGALVGLLVAGPIVLAVPAVHLLGGRGNGLFTAWLFGAAISWVWPALGRSNVPGQVLLAVGSAVSTAAVVVLFTFAEEAYDLRFSAAFSLGLALVLAGLPDRSPQPAATAWWRRTVTYLASYSFSLYLLHYTVSVALLSVLDPSLSTFVTILVVSNVVAMGFAWVTERHHLQVRAWMRDRRDRRRGAVERRPATLG